MTIDELNQLSADGFTAALGAIYEHSPWIAARCETLRPFADIGALYAAMGNVVRQATHEEQIALIAAHPDLGGRLARAGKLEPSSADEQAALGLDRLTDSEFAALDSMNATYRERFGFPFVIAVKNHTRSTMQAAFAARLQNLQSEEEMQALQEINAIAGFRLESLFHETLGAGLDTASGMRAENRGSLPPYS